MKIGSRVQLKPGHTQAGRIGYVVKGPCPESAPFPWVPLYQVELEGGEKVWAEELKMEVIRGGQDPSQGI